MEEMIDLGNGIKMMKRYLDEGRWDVVRRADPDLAALNLKEW